MSENVNQGLENLKQDINKLGNILRESEKGLNDRINNTDADVAKLNTSVLIMVDKLSTFIEAFKDHDRNEINKYDDILEMFKGSREEFKKLEESTSKNYVTKEELHEIKRALKENSDAVKQGFKIFYIGTGVLLSLGTFGSLVMYILNLTSQLQSLGVHP